MLQIPPCTVSRKKMSHVCLICPKSYAQDFFWVIPHNDKTLDAFYEA